MNINHKLLTFLLIMFSKNILSQSMLFENKINFNNNFLSLQNIEDVFTTGFLDNDFKNNISNNLNDKNIFEGEININTSFEIKEDIYFNIELKNQAIGKISEDIINLGLFGNTRYLGENLNFKNDYILINRYSKVGLKKLILKKEKEELFVTPNILIGHQFFEYNIEEGELMTSANGDFIDYTIKAQSHSSEMTNFNSLKVNGIGLGLDIYYYKQIKNNDIKVSIEDIGVIKWNRNVENYTADTICYFQGIVIDDIFEINDSILNNSIDDLNSNYQSNQNKYSLKLPFKINAILKRNINIRSLDFIKLKIKHQPAIYQNPEFSGLLGCNFKNNYLEFGLKYGVAKRVSFVLDINIKCKKFEFYFKTNNLENIINLEQSYGMSLMSGLKINLK